MRWFESSRPCQLRNSPYRSVSAWRRKLRRTGNFFAPSRGSGLPLEQPPPLRGDEGTGEGREQSKGKRSETVRGVHPRKNGGPRKIDRFCGERRKEWSGRSPRPAGRGRSRGPGFESPPGHQGKSLVAIAVQCLQGIFFLRALGKHAPKWPQKPMFF